MIEKIFIIAFFTLGYCCTFWPGMIFGRIGDYMDTHAPEWLWKPLGGCYICACMWVGSVVYLLLYAHVCGIWAFNWVDWFASCVGAMGVNAVISQFVDKEHEAETTETPCVNIYDIVPKQKGSEGE